MAFGMRHNAPAASAEKPSPSGKSGASLEITAKWGLRSTHQSRAAYGAGPTRAIARRWNVLSARCSIGFDRPSHACRISGVQHWTAAAESSAALERIFLLLGLASYDIYVLHFTSLPIKVTLSPSDLSRLSSPSN
jgi:hypothetical protein